MMPSQRYRNVKGKLASVAAFEKEAQEEKSNPTEPPKEKPKKPKVGN